MEEPHERGDDAESTRISSGWVNTDVAARALGVTPRTIRAYIEQGKIEARSQGEGVKKTWTVSIDSIHRLRDTRSNSASNPQEIREDPHADTIPASLFREIADRLELRAAEVAELRTRLEITEQAESTLREERERLLQDLERERERAERERERAAEAQVEAEKIEESRDQSLEEVQHLREELEAKGEEADRLREELEAERGKGFWRRLFGG